MGKEKYFIAWETLFEDEQRQQRVYDEDIEKESLKIIEDSRERLNSLGIGKIEMPIIDKSKKVKKAEKILWNGSETSLTFLFSLLKEAKYIKNDTNIARHIVENYIKSDGKEYDIESKDHVETLRKLVNSGITPNKKDARILDIITKAIIDIDKELKTK